MLETELRARPASTPLPQRAARHLPPAQVRAVVIGPIEKPWLGFMGPAHVSVLRLNLALDGQRR